MRGRKSIRRAGNIIDIMKAILSRLRAIAPFETNLLEAFLLRLGLALLVWRLFPLATFPNEPAPNGLARIPGVTFTWLDRPEVLALCQWIMLAALILFVLHRFAGAALVVITSLLIASGTLANSQSAEVTHHSQIIALTMLALTIWYFAGRAKGMLPSGPANGRIDWHRNAMFIVMQVIIATYMVSVVSKMYYSEGEWIKRAANIPVQLEKNRLASHYNQVGRQPERDRMTFEERLQEATQDAFIASPTLARASMTAGMLLEAFCFLALLGRRPALAVGLLLIAFHLVISWTMNLTFRYHLYLLALYFVAVPWWTTRLIPESWRNHRVIPG